MTVSAMAVKMVRNVLMDKTPTTVSARLGTLENYVNIVRVIVHGLFLTKFIIY